VDGGAFCVESKHVGNAMYDGNTKMLFLCGQQKVEERRSEIPPGSFSRFLVGTKQKSNSAEQTHLDTVIGQTYNVQYLIS